MGFNLGFKGLGSQGVKLTTHLCLLLRLRMSGAILLLPHMLPWQDRDCFTFFVYDVYSVWFLRP